MRKPEHKLTTGKEKKAKLKDGDRGEACFLDIDIVGHSLLSRIFPEAIVKTKINLHNWLNSIISKYNGKELSWLGDGGTFYFLHKNIDDKAVENAVLSSRDILDGLQSFNNSYNELLWEGKRTDIRLRLGIDFGSFVYHKDPGNWHSDAINTAAKIQKDGFPNSLLITQNAYSYLTDSIRTELGFEETSIKFNDKPLYIFCRERIIEPCYVEYFRYISALRQREFEHLRHWVSLYAVETKLANIVEDEKRPPKPALDVVKGCISRGNNAVIFGESGSGKTFTCLRLFESLKDEYLTRPLPSKGEIIPLFVELSRLKGSNKDLESLIKERLGGVFDRDKEKYVIFLDGLNETGDIEKQRGVFEEIYRFAQDNPSTRLFVTSQTVDKTYKTFELYEIQPLKREDVIKYLTGFKDKFESEDEALLFYDSLPDLIKEFICIPIFLYIIVCTYERGKPIEITNPGELLRNYEEFLCGSRSEWRESGRPALDEDYQTKVIPFIAFKMCLKNEKMIIWKRFNEYIREFEEETSSSTIRESDVKDAVTKRFRLMKTGENEGFEFIHQTLRDYFAAVWLKNFSTDKIFKLVHANNDLVNAIRLFSGIVKPETAKDIIGRFIEKDLYLACEMFAWSSITEFEEEFLNPMVEKIDINSREYLLNLNVVVSFYLKILDILNKAKRKDEPIYADHLQGLGIAYNDKLDYNRAIEAFQKAIKIYEQNNMQNHPSYALCHMNLGDAYDDKLDYDRAIELYKKAIKIYEQSNMQNHPSYALCHMNLGDAYWSKLHYNRAIEAYEKAIKIYEQNNMQNHPSDARCHMNLGLAYRDTGKKLMQFSLLK